MSPARTERTAAASRRGTMEASAMGAMKPSPFLLVGIIIAAAVVLSLPAPAASQAAPNFSLITSPDLPLAGDRVTVTVLPANFTASTTMFAWFRDDVRLAAVSGVGRSSIRIATDPARQETIRVRVEAGPGPGFATGTASLLIHTFLNPNQQEEAASDIGTDFTLEASNISPNSGETVELNVVTFAFDKQAATYQWYVAGTPDRAASGRGQSRFSLPAPAEGVSRTVRVDVTIPGSGVRSKSIAIQTASAPLYWWADTTVPYWYRGKTLPSSGARITLFSLPGGQDASQLFYQWQLNGSVLPKASGVGRQTFSFAFDFPVSERIGVRMQDAAGAFDKTVSLAVAPVRTRVAIYEVRPLRGVVAERELATFSAPAGSAYDFLAVPFFFPRSRAAALSYRWLLNGTEITGTFARPALFTLKPRAGEVSSAELQIEIADPQAPGGRANAAVRTDFQ